jgi:peptidyl-prolyl cis-trans isomerase SurA
MKKVFLALLLSVFALTNAQDLVMTVDNQAVTADEFERMYTKNLDLVQDESQKDIDNYLTLFTNYKLELADAYHLRYDTLPKFTRELRSYRRDLAKKYLSDEEIVEKLIKEAYERKKFDVRVAHILIQVAQDASPKDTLKAFKKIQNVYNQAIKNKDFAKLALQYSQDPSVKENKGDLDYINIFNTVYPFETAAYNTPVGKISKPFRTRFGYHILKVIDKRPARPELEVAHIMTMDRKKAEGQANAKERILEIYNKLKSGKADFANLATKFSDDKSTSKYGGRLRRFGIREMIPEFEEQAYKLKKEGDISQPFKTKYGWHIVKLLHKYSLPTFEKYRKTLKYKITRDGRSKLGKEKLMKRIENQFEISIKGSLSKVNKLVTDKFFANLWEIPNKPINKETLFVIDGKRKVSYNDFFKYLYRHQLKNKRKNIDKQQIINRLFEQFKKDELMKYYDENLENIYPEFKAIMQEYKDGLLMFYIKSDKVWDKSVKDTIGLQKFYNDNKEIFKQPKKYSVLIVQANSKKTAKKIAKLLDKKIDSKELKKQFNDLIIKEKVFNYNDKFIVEHNLDKNKIVRYKEKNDAHTQYIVLKLLRIIPSEIPDFKDVKGSITNEYQKYLEKQWLQELKAKYPVKINEANWKKLRAKYKK